MQKAWGKSYSIWPIMIPVCHSTEPHPSSRCYRDHLCVSVDQWEASIAAVSQSEGEIVTVFMRVNIGSVWFMVTRPDQTWQSEEYNWPLRIINIYIYASVWIHKTKKYSWWKFILDVRVFEWCLSVSSQTWFFPIWELRYSLGPFSLL